MVFVQSYLLMHRQNDVAVIACANSASQMLFPTAVHEDEQRSFPNGGMSTKELQSCIMQGLECLSAEANTPAGGTRNSSSSSSTPAAQRQQGSAIAKGLSQGLCLINRRAAEAPNTQARVLVIQAENDAPDSYNAIMNCIFSANKAAVLVDCCCVGSNSMFLQQAADITAGVYLHCQEPAMLQHLLMSFLPSQSCRKYLRQRRQESVDFRAACFCHRRIIEIAYVCSVCLSVFCEFSPVCATCGTRAAPKRKRLLNGAANAT